MCSRSDESKVVSCETGTDGKEGHNKIASQSDRRFAERDVQSGTGERSQDIGARFRENANAFYSDFAGR